MAKTSILDVIVPEVFNPYMIQRTAALSKLRVSGIALAVPGIVIPEGGTTIKLPFWNDLDAGGDYEVLSDSGALTPAKIGADKDIAAILARGKAWSSNDLAKAFAGDDPMKAIAELLAAWEARQEQKILISVLKGIFAAASMAGNILDITALAGNLNKIQNGTMIDAIALLGDSGAQLTGIMMHSAAFYDLAKKKVFDQKAYGSGELKPEDFTYLGRKVVVDDGLAPTGGNYPTYFFGQAAIGYAEGGAPVPTEVDRNSLASDDILIRRNHFIMHPRGVKWIGTPAGATPSAAELETGTNWSRVYENKNVRIVKFVHKIGDLV